MNNQTPQELAFQKTTLTLNDIRHGINIISDKAFAENLITECNKSRRSDIGDGERTRSLLTALLDRIKRRPETFDTLVGILKDTTGMDYIGEELQKNLERVKMELTVQGISHHGISHESCSFPTNTTVTRDWNGVSSHVDSDFFSPSVSPFTKHGEDSLTHPKPVMSVSRVPSTEHDPVAHLLLPVSSTKKEIRNFSSSLVVGQTSLPSQPNADLRTNLQVPEPTNIYVRSNSQCSSDSDSDYTTPQQSLSDSKAEQLFKDISRRTLCKESLAQKVQLLQAQEEIRKLKTKLQVQDEVMLDQAEALKEEIVRREVQCNSLKDTCNNAVAFMLELEEKVTTLAHTVEKKEMEKQEAWRYYEVSNTLLLKTLSQQAAHNDDSSPNHTYEEVCKLRSKLGKGTEEGYSRSQRVTEMLNSCSSMMLPQGIPQQGRTSLRHEK
jgi:hypothetical protein